MQASYQYRPSQRRKRDQAPKKQQQIQPKPKTKPTCRICYGEDTNEKNPLICPCKCYGSMKFVHLSCLKNNINLKIHKKHDKCYDMYLFQNYNCEICLSTFPKYLIIKNKKVNLLELDTSNYKNYALCDLIQYDENKK